MIQQKDLRVGNFVLVPSLDAELYEVCQINRYGRDCVVTDNKLGYKSATLDIEKVDPILLTAEHLEALGFQKLNNGGIVDNGSRNEHGDVIHGEKTFGLFDHSFGKLTDLKYRFTSIKYVHELQNLYYAIEGKELELTLPVE